MALDRLGQPANSNC